MNHSRPITIVTGLPRSGTSMMMQMLRAGGLPVLTDGVPQADIDNPRGYFELEAVKATKRDASWLTDAPGKAVKLVHLLLLDLPDDYQYQVVFMRRDLDEVLRSQAAMLQRLGKPGASLPPDKLKRVFADQLERVDAALQKRPNFRVLHVDYGRAVTRPAAVAQEVNVFLGDNLNVSAMAKAVDPKLYRQGANDQPPGRAAPGLG